MQISKLCEGANVIKFIGVDKETEISRLTIDYKTADADSVFFALKGKNYDGNIFASEVLQKGGIVVSDNVDFAHNLLISGGKNFILTKDARVAMSNLSANFYENPQEKLKIIMVTGTNGKTSTACIIRDIFEYSGIRTGIIGTLETRFEETVFESDMTTPDPIYLYKILHKMQKLGAKVVVMEWSAHAIALKKLENLTAEIGIFTNLSQDHLDFFGDMESYKNAKKIIFDKRYVKTAVVNADDEVGIEIIREAKVPMLSYGIENVCDVFCILAEDMEKYTNEILQKENDGTGYDKNRFIVNYLDEICEIATELDGRFNIYNLLGAVTASRYFGLDFENIKNGILQVKGVAGRYQQVRNSMGIEIVVDYAHTPDGVENILKEMRYSLDKRMERLEKKSNLIAIFGCGGNRDASKRCKMGEIAEKYSDLIVITSDNPRFENPEKIASDILQGVKDKGKTLVVLDRESAISYAISIAKEGDSIAVLGKGHEEYIEEAGEKRDFSDVETIKKYIKF